MVLLSISPTVGHRIIVAVLSRRSRDDPADICQRLRTPVIPILSLTGKLLEQSVAPESRAVAKLDPNNSQCIGMAFPTLILFGHEQSQRGSVIARSGGNTPLSPRKRLVIIACFAIRTGDAEILICRTEIAFKYRNQFLNISGLPGQRLHDGGKPVVISAPTVTSPLGSHRNLCPFRLGHLPEDCKPFRTEHICILFRATRPLVILGVQLE